jgi:Transporter associated domain
MLDLVDVRSFLRALITPAWRHRCSRKSRTMLALIPTTHEVHDRPYGDVDLPRRDLSKAMAPADDRSHWRADSALLLRSCFHIQGPQPRADGSVLVDGAAAVRYLNQVMGWNLPDNEATTIAGLFIHEAAAIPEVGQTFAFHGFRFEVLSKTRNRIEVLKMTPRLRGKQRSRCGQSP